jgi:hypothetical protein
MNREFEILVPLKSTQKTGDGPQTTACEFCVGPKKARHTLALARKVFTELSKIRREEVSRIEHSTSVKRRVNPCRAIFGRWRGVHRGPFSIK